jgi:hypothetical protein
MFIQLAAVIKWLCAALVFSLYCSQRLFIYHYPNVRDLIGGWVLDPRLL